MRREGKNNGVIEPNEPRLRLGVDTLMRYLDEVSRDEVQGSQLLKNQKMRPSERTFL